MKIELERLDQAYRFAARNEDGQEILIDNSEENGGQGQGFRPMQMLAAAVGGCSAIDVISILKKQREPVEDIKISIEADREKDKVPALFTKIQVHYKIFGNVNEEKAKRALDLSFGTYCSVSKSLGPVTEVTYSFEIIPGKAE